MTFRQAICLSRSSNWGDGVQAGAALVTVHCFAWPRIAADDVQTGMLVLRHRERCPNGESRTGRLASCGHGHGEEAGGGREVGGGGGPASAHAAGADPSRFTPLPRLRGVAVYYNVVLLFRVLVSCGSSRRPCEVTSVLGLPGGPPTPSPRHAHGSRHTRARVVHGTPHHRSSS